MLDKAETYAAPTLTAQTTPLSNRKSWILPVSLALIYLLTLAYLGRTHTFGTYSTETDFYHLYAPDAERIAAGQFPENTYQGPGYPALLVLGAKLTGDLFLAGKWISILSAALVVLLLFQLGARLFGYWAGIGAALIVMVSGPLPQYAIQATTDVFFLMLCLAALAVLTGERLSARWRVMLAAVIVGAAYLTRYNGVFLVAAGLFGILALGLFRRPWRARLTLAAAFLLIFMVTVSPWLYLNYQHRGAPFYNTNYLNMATLFYPDLAGGRTDQDGTRKLEEVFDSFSAMLRYNPRQILARYPANLYDCLKRSVTSNLVSPWVGWLALAGSLLALLERRSKAVLLLLLAGAGYFLLMALNHWETRYFFFIAALYAALAAYAAIRPLELARARGWLRPRVFALIPIALVAVMWADSFAFSRSSMQRFLSSHPVEVLSACEYLKREGVSGARVVARKPHLAYICGQQWVFFPQVKSLDELREWLRRSPVDYLFVGSVELARRRELAALKDPHSAPPWLKAVWVSADPACVLYKPVMSGE
jgi:hypothetical protein